ncbi:methylmalonyl-CoA mutase family protein [Neolewinella lacunae]|uniref:Methylmalonyl-CoA mutase alpha/beta chain catalytic domain-containing protein n=1 Tax=Neolewinella lacunae TaxID=1517758 RepID=A0A923PNI5_9BACT|nr:methylmalonyl-CoA mutase family protein [Neolewinella lacunae]MBC6994564.1 hypothetical protein [Neolewinella lacunae]MDN3633913.1 methylmalonyl-CoA mutase family protein [Neolewinella lacunae]
MEFPSVTKAAWLAQVRKDLKGQPLEDLNFSVAGTVQSPFWHPEDLPNPPAPVYPGRGWKVGEKITITDPATANAQALAALRGGANYLYFCHAGPLAPADRTRVLEEVLTDIIDLRFHDTTQQAFRVYTRADVAEALLALAEQPQDAAFWLRPSEDFLETIATLRAVRLCANLIYASLELDPSLELGVVISPAELDVHTAKIRNPVLALAAVCGGADVLLIEPADGPEGSPFERRIARNIHHLLSEEARLAAVADPAAGSYYLEALTDAIATAIWADFQATLAR